MGIKLINNLCINGSFESVVQIIPKDTEISLNEGMFVCDLWKVIACPKNSTYRLLSTGGIEFSGDVSFGGYLILEHIGIDNSGYVDGETQYITSVCRATNVSGDGNATIYIEPKSSKLDKHVDVVEFESYTTSINSIKRSKIIRTVNEVNAVPTIGSRVVCEFKIAGEFKIAISSFIEIAGFVTGDDVDLNSVVTSSVSEIQSINAYTEKGSVEDIMAHVYKVGSDFLTDISVKYQTVKLRKPDVVLNLSNMELNGIETDKSLTSVALPNVTIIKNDNNSGFIIRFNWGSVFDYSNIIINNIKWLASI